MCTLERASLVVLLESCRPPRPQLSAYGEAHDGHVRAIPRPPTPSDGNDSAPMQSDGVGPADDDRTSHDAGHLPLGRQRREFPYRPARVLPGASMGDAVLG